MGEKPCILPGNGQPIGYTGRMSFSGPTPSTPARAMILAAGRGERMRPLTDTTPKPLLTVQGQTLIERHLQALALGGLRHVLINTAWLGHKISDHLGHKPLLGRHGPLSLSYSHEGRDFGGALETAGGIVRALPQLDDVFWVLAADVYAPNFVFSQDALARFAASGKLAHLWLVPNPSHNPGGDFGLSADPHQAAAAPELALNQAAVKYTYSTIGLFHRDLFSPPFCGIPHGNPEGVKAPLAPLLRAAMDNHRVSAELYRGAWTDVGTPARLAQLNPSATPTP
jgi:MurNAc alpha-1-phosphate uridylyltransferase